MIQLTYEEIDGCDDNATLMQWHFETYSRLQAVRIDLAEARTKAGANGEDSSPEWYIYELRKSAHLNRILARIQMRIGLLRPLFEKNFMDAAKDYLSDSDYTAITNIAKGYSQAINA